MATPHDPDPAACEAFAGRMAQVFNDGCLAFLSSVGHQTGLFDAMRTMSPTTSTDLARACDLDERYVREWLGGMVVGRFVDYDPQSGTYVLPPEHAASLTRAAGTRNLAEATQYLALMGEVEERVVEACRQGGGVPYSAYPRFRRLQAEASAQVIDAALVDGVLPMADDLTDRLRQGIDAIDIGTGRGHAVHTLARAFPKSRFRGIDICEEGIAAARRGAAELGLRNTDFAVADAAELTGRYDLVTAFDVIHELAHPTRTLAAVSRALRPDGLFLMADVAASSALEENIDHPLGPTLYALSLFHCMTVSLGQGGEGLGAAWGERAALSKLAEAGFTEVRTHQVDGDVLNRYYLARRG
ncbi:class I SAM-dependent methyltransferase [Streptomyces palmae]|uniref:Class I SAM-dependent methyltransferase n=1 Tax=Streptomyces palmae TaxID=1701085 RepID=A0A4Z0GWU3_9ACTN|nr:class I SAM-dependent methyltransferase [Streptomyces palmae]TGB00970.1 class I SAM-dependent methyltransferase [Streptomyces palmae]